jgi:hypothetical protein
MRPAAAPTLKEHDMEGEILRNDGFGTLRAAQRGWFIHASVYLAVNLMFVALALVQGRSPMLAPALGWGLGLAIHGTIAFFVVGRSRRAVLR